MRETRVHADAQARLREKCALVAQIGRRPRDHPYRHLRRPRDRVGLCLVPRTAEQQQRSRTDRVQALGEGRPVRVEPVFLRTCREGQQADGGCAGLLTCARRRCRQGHGERLGGEAEVGGETAILPRRPIWRRGQRRVHPLRVKQLRSFARTQTDAAPGTACRRPDRTLEQTLRVDGEGEAARAQRAGEIPGDGQGAQEVAAAGRRRQYQHLVEERMAVEQFFAHRRREPAYESVGPALAQGGKEGRGEDDVADGAEADDEDAWRVVGRDGPAGCSRVARGCRAGRR